MKIFAEKLDNGYRLNITTMERPQGDGGEIAEPVEVKQRLVYESKQQLMVKLEEVL